MENPILELKNITIVPESVHLYIPPIVWKGDSVGHIGTFDVFFLVLEGECFLKIDSEQALQAATEKFIQRFAGVEQLAQERGIDMKESSLEVLDQLWDEVKRRNSR
jgi:uncharacterized protein YabN with tetrapyrrole methylase and pyrophosphatase domain